MSIAEIVESVVAGPLPLRLVAYDGSELGPGRRHRAPCTCAPPARRPTSPPHPATSGWPGPTWPATSTVEGVHPGDPYDLLVDLADVRFQRRRPRGPRSSSRAPSG